MKIAIVTDDKENIAMHFGRALGFMIYEIEDNKIINKEYRENTFTGHVRGEHNHENNEHQSSTHSRILNALNDCSVVISRGMGRRIYDDLKSANIEAYITDKIKLNDAINAYIEGELKDNNYKACEH